MVELDQGGRLAGQASVVPVPAVLREVAEHSFILRTEHEQARSWRIVPDLSAHLLVHFTSGPSGTVPLRASLVGARTVYCDAPVRQRSHSVGVRLAAGVLPRLTGSCATEFLDRSVRLSELWPLETERLMNRIVDDCAPQVARTALLDFLTELTRADDQIDWRVRGFTSRLRTQPHLTLDRRADCLGLTTRTLRRVCVERVGLSPKHIARVVRLHRVIATSIGRPTVLGSRLAAIAGFSDQAHMIREFRGLLGETPGQFGSRRRAA